MKRTTSHYACSECDTVHDAEFWTTASRWLLVGGPSDLCDLIRGEWVVVHARSGLITAEAPDPEAAQFMAQQLSELDIDWSLSGKELQRFSHLVPAHLIATIDTGDYAPVLTGAGYEAFQL